jgi:hypothetical protein
MPVAFVQQRHGKLYPEATFVFAPTEVEASRSGRVYLKKADILPNATWLFLPLDPDQVPERKYYRTTTGEVCYRQVRWVPLQHDEGSDVAQAYGPGYGVDPVTLNHNGRLYPVTEFPVEVVDEAEFKLPPEVAQRLDLPPDHVPFFVARFRGPTR